MRIFAWIPIMIVLFAAILPMPHGAMAADDAWDDILKQARGQTVDWFMWGGFPHTNDFVNGYVAPQVESRFGITLRQVPVTDIAEVVGKLLVEKQAGKIKGGQADLLWINGENFRTAKKNGLLHGPFAHVLPNSQYVNSQSVSIKNDFGEPVNGLESPWGSAQFVMIYDTRRTPQPPRTIAQLLAWIQSHPGRFAYPAPPDFTGSVFVRHMFYHVAGGPAPWQGAFDPARFESAATQCYQVLRDIAPALWRQGRTYPQHPGQLNQLFADGEIDFSFSYHPAEASKAIADGLYHESVRTFVFEEGAIANTHFVAIPFNAADTAGAMVVADFLLSPEAQLQKADPRVWGDLPVIDLKRLPADWQEKFNALPRGQATLPGNVLQAHQWPEPPSRILIELENGWRRHVLKGR